MSTSDDGEFVFSYDEAEEVEFRKSGDKKKTKNLQRTTTSSIYNKVFSSGQDLVGHSRIHNQPNKKPNLGVIKNSQYPNKNASSEEEYVRNQTRDSATMFRSRVDLTGFLQGGWLSKNIRGRKGTKEHEPMGSDKEELVPDPISLGHRAAARGIDHQSSTNREQEPVRSKIKIKNPSNRKVSGDPEVVACSSRKEPSSTCKSSKVCNKRSATSQALGGDRSIRNKIKNPWNNAISGDDDEEVAYRSRLETRSNKPSKPKAFNRSRVIVQALKAIPSSIHSKEKTKKQSKSAISGDGTKAVACKICNKSFASKQALGGPMTAHRTSRSSKAAVSPGKGNSNSGRRPVVDFDLNEVPEVESEDETQVTP